MDWRGNNRNALRRAVSAAALALVALGAQAHAAETAANVAPIVNAAISTATCPLATFDQGGGALQEPAIVSKSAAILGGQSSALEAIRAQQASFDTMGPLIPQADPEMRPAAGPMSTTGTSLAPLPLPDCAPSMGLTSTRFVDLSHSVGQRPLGANDFLGSRRIQIGRTSFDADWKRVSHEKQRLGRELRGLVAASDTVEGRLEAVNGWVNHTIAYADDQVLFGKADYWAGPRRTLKLGKGDCEDFALLKLSLLAAAGVPREDMYLTIARDLVRHADHAVLIVRTDDGYRMLDNATDQVLDATQANDYRPVLSLSGSRSWLHGY
jgi:predicted transglutaminase-like cysteine proteinase